MKTLFLYYSLEGNCRALAQLMAAETAGTVEELRLADGDAPAGAVTKYLAGGKASLLKEAPPLAPLAANLEDYDLVVVGGPVWAWNMAPAVRSFLSIAQWQGRRVALFVMHRGGKGFALSGMESLVVARDGVVAGRADFKDLRRGDAAATRARAVDWIRGLATSS